MKWLQGAAVAALTAVFGLVVAGVVASLAVEWYRISSFEGGSGYFVVFAALFGGIIGGLVGLVSAWIVLTRPGGAFLKSLMMSFAVVLAAGGAVAGGSRLLADVPPVIDGEQLYVSIELRWPAGLEPQRTAATPGVVTLGSIRGSTVRETEDGPFFTDRAALTDGRWIVPGEVRLFTERRERLLKFTLGQETLPAFALPLPAHPGREFLEWSGWLPSTDDLKAADGFRYRFRIRRSGETVRVDRVGPFTIATRSHGYFHVGGTDAFASESDFGVTYHDAPIEGLDSVATVAVAGGPEPALIITANGDGVCRLVRDRDGRATVESLGPCDMYGAAARATADQATFDAARQSPPLRGWLDMTTFKAPGVYQISQVVLDTRSFTAHPFTYLSDYPPFVSVPPVDLSPDERSLVMVATEREHDTLALVVLNRITGALYPLEIDRRRMRYNDEKAIGPAWVAHHFTWEPGEGGERLVPRRDFDTLPYHGDLTLAKAGEYQSYTLRPGGAFLREVIMRLIVSRLGGERLPDQYDGYQQRVRVDGAELHLTVGESPSYVAVSMDGPSADPAVMASVGRQLDEIIASGEFDAVFVEPTPPAP